MIENTFGKNIIPENDLERLKVLQRYRIMDSPSEKSFDNIATLCTQIFKVPIALVSLVDAERVFFKAQIGMGNAIEANRGKSLCALAVLNPEITVFEDALKEPCLIANPNVAGAFGLRFYAGAPLITHDGFLIGTLCIIDKKPRNFSEGEKIILKGLAIAVMDQIELRLSALEEIHSQMSKNAVIVEQQEELQTMNEEINSTNEELATLVRELHTSQDLLINSHNKLTQSEHRFRNLIQQSTVAIAVLSGPKFIIESANDRIISIWGKDRSVIGKPLHIALPDLAGQPFLDILANVYSSGETFHGTEAKLTMPIEHISKDIYVNYTYQPVLENGKTIDIIVVASEVTEQVNARKEVEEINNRLQIALDASALGSTEVVLATGKMSSTDQFKANYGFEAKEEFNYPDLFNSMLPEYRDRIKELVAQAIAENSVYKAEYPVKWRDGSIHWISAHGRPRYDESGKADRMVGMSADITEQKLFQQRKDDFLSIASHELKTPITSLKAALQLLDRIKDKPTTTTHIKLIEQSNRATEKISLLVNDLLNLNRMTEGQLKLNKTIFIISEMFSQCCNHVRMEGKYNLIFEGDTKLAVHADEHRIDQVLVNFINNAIKYAPESIDIHVHVSKIGDQAKVSVKDTGVGISPEILPNLFDRYYRVDHNSKNYSGLGLGLYICSEIIKRHGGEIGVESEPDKGSTFWFTIPIG